MAKFLALAVGRAVGGIGSVTTGTLAFGGGTTGPVAGEYVLKEAHQTNTARSCMFEKQRTSASTVWASGSRVQFCERRFATRLCMYLAS